MSNYKEPFYFFINCMQAESHKQLNPDIIEMKIFTQPLTFQSVMSAHDLPYD